MITIHSLYDWYSYVRKIQQSVPYTILIYEGKTTRAKTVRAKVFEDWDLSFDP